ncbi:MAG TPA: hypothetical protein EYQ69_09535 [Gemmatimonadetes bacterium]|nr:hypothetical protein [Gemmatimonadota bacterium]
MDNTEQEQLTGLGATGLLLVILLLSVLNPGVVVATSFLWLVVIFGMTRWIGLGMAVVAGTIVMFIPGTGELWYLERSWSVLLAGCFVTITMMFPSAVFFNRALGSLCVMLIMVGVFFASNFQYWYIMDGIMNQNIMNNITRSLLMFSDVDSDLMASEVFRDRAMELAGYQFRFFPALLALSSLASMAVAWWGYVGLSGKGLRNLKGLNQFKFNDHLVWCLIVGLLVVFWDFSDGWSRIGENLVVFMTALYVMRGMAVVFVTTGMLFFGKMSLFLGLILLGPLLLLIAFVIGLSDIWFDYRNRVRILKKSNQ